MIREKAVFIKLNQLHFSDQDLFDKALSSFNPSKCFCPYCGASDSLSSFGSYKRDIITVSDGKRFETNISVPRFLCSSCEHTHAFLPDVLIPFGSYTLRFILTVLREFLLHNCTVSSLCRRWQISISTLYSWIHRFIDHYNAWCDVIDRILWISCKSLSSVFDFKSFAYDFYRRFGFSFLQGSHPTHSKQIHPPDRRYRSRIT